MPLSEPANEKHRTIIARHSNDWQRQLADAITDPVELLTQLGLEARLTAAGRAAARTFPLRVTRHFVSLMRPRDPGDPLLRQVLPLGDECEPRPGFTTDPVGDGAAYIGGGLLHKYRGRALLIATGACAIHCRYCFRRHYPYAEHGLTRSERDKVIARLRAMPDIDEVILSGGDPLSLPDERLAPLLAELAGLPRIRRIRIHTRQPVVLPARVTPGLIDALRLPVPVVVVLHVNHARELSPPLRDGLDALKDAKPWLLNQSVLLRGVNDDVESLRALNETLFDAGILPYYLHQLDAVAGAAHFAVSDDRARHLRDALQATLPGYLVPRLVRESAGHPGKVLL